jgi:hypothetical protein
MYELLLVRLNRPDHACNCSGSGFLRAPVQSQRRDQEEKDNYDPYVREKVQSERTKFFFIKFKSFDQPRNIGMPQSQGDNPVEQREEDTNDKGAQEKFLKKMIFSRSTVLLLFRTQGLMRAYPAHEICVNKRKPMYQFKACESAK